MTSVRVAILAAGFCCAAPAAESESQQIKFESLHPDIKPGETYDAERHLKLSVKQLDGRKIRVVGAMLPTLKASGISKFFLFSEVDIFEQPSPRFRLGHCIVVDLAAETPTKFTVKPITVEGVFELKEFRDDKGAVLAIYRLKDARVFKMPSDK